MQDPTFFALAFIGLVFGGVAALSGLLRAGLILAGVIRTLASEGQGGSPTHPRHVPHSA